MKNAIGENIKYLRLKNKWKQDDLSRRTGIPRAMISQYETGKAKPKIDRLSVCQPSELSSNFDSSFFVCFLLKLNFFSIIFKLSFVFT